MNIIRNVQNLYRCNRFDMFLAYTNTDNLDMMVCFLYPVGEVLQFKQWIHEAQEAWDGEPHICGIVFLEIESQQQKNQNVDHNKERA